MMIWLILPACIIAFYAFMLVHAVKKRKTISSDGHAVKKEQDLTCEATSGHHHPADMEYGPRYVVHNDPEQGWVILNGVKRKLTDCRDL